MALPFDLQGSRMIMAASLLQRTAFLLQRISPLVALGAQRGIMIRTLEGELSLLFCLCLQILLNERLGLCSLNNPTRHWIIWRDADRSMSDVW